MYEHLKTITVKKTRKRHECNACCWITEVLSEIRSGEIKMTISERRAILRMQKNGWYVPSGSKCEYSVGIYDGDFFASCSDIEMHEICIKYNLYPDD